MTPGMGALFSFKRKQFERSQFVNVPTCRGHARGTLLIFQQQQPKDPSAQYDVYTKIQNYHS